MQWFAHRKRLVWIAAALSGLVFAGLAVTAANRIQTRQLRAEIEQVRQAMARRRFALAHKELTELARRWPKDGEVLLLLGRCEEAQGRSEQALAAWSRVPTSDPLFVHAAESHGGLLINLGRYTPAESFLQKALKATPPADRYPLIRSLARLYKLEGRFVEVSDALIAAWSLTPNNPGELLQDLWQNDTEPIPVDGWKLFLDAADGQDDRVWLGRARHALLTGRTDEARAWLDRCLERRPDDPVVWRAYLDLAMSSDDEAGFWKAAERIPAESFKAWELASVRSWLAARTGDRTAERRELSLLIEVQPSHTQALERLAVLAMEAGEPKEAERLQRRKAEIDRAKDGIHKLVVRKIDFASQAKDLAAFSTVLGRSFDAHAWTLVGGVDGVEPNAAGSTGRPPSSGPSQSQKFCRAVSDEAMARLLTAPEKSPLLAGRAMADRLADLRTHGNADQNAAVSARLAGPTNPSGTRLHFVDDAEAVGLQFIFDNGRTPMFHLPETLSGGLALIDYDNDGWLDVYCVQGGEFAIPDARPSGGRSEPSPGATLRPGDRLFRNQGDGTFRDVTSRSRLDRLAWGHGYGMGVSVGDYDNDGRADLFITRLHRYDLFRNRGDGTFEDVTERAGLAGPRDNPTSSAFADLDGDGDLDLYVCHYIRLDLEHPVLCKDAKGEYYYCDPAKHEPATDRVFRNDHGYFVDVTERAGFTDPDGRGLGVVAADLDDDNRIDLYVANDGTANFLFRNQGGFRFEDIALTAGVAGSAEGGFQAGMGVISADLDGDGRFDLMVNNLYLEGSTLYQNLGQGMFADRSAASGILQATKYLLGFGIAALDAGNDGRLDVASANGNVNDFRPVYPFAMPARLFEGRPGGRLADVSNQAGPPWSVPRLGRGLVAGDLDNDGRVDLLVLSQNEPLAYFHNRTERAGHFVTFRLEGTKSNRDGVGARVIVTTSQGRQVAQRVGGGSYLSACDGRLHFGLGGSATVESVEVRWPSGQLDRWRKIAGDRGYLLREGASAPTPLPGF